MAILVNEDTRVIIQGITGKQGSYHAARMLEYNVKLVGGVVPGRGGRQVEGVPVFDTVAEACAATRVDASLVLVPPPFVLEAAAEAIDCGIPLVVVITEHVPVQDSMRLVALARQRGVRVVGPNTIGVISPGKSKVGIMPGYIYSPGPVGIVSRSGTLTHEVASNLTFRGIGQSTCVGIGGDPIVGTTFVEVLELFRAVPYRLVVTSAVTGEGLEELRPLLGGRVSVLAGQSGVGKSRLLNALKPGLGLATGDISPRIRRGRHTTRLARLLDVDGGMVADTPGFSRLDLEGVEPRHLAALFPELAALAPECRFADCFHRAEPECAVRKAVEEGTVARWRYRLYLELLSEIEEALPW